MTIEQAHQSGIASAHTVFECLTGKRYQLHTHRIWHWEKFLVARHFTEADIETVVKYLQSEMAAKRAYPPQLWFVNLIEQPDKFEEYLGDAKAKARNAIPAKTNREAVLESIGRVAKKQEDGVITMNERVQWHLLQMRKAVDSSTKGD